VPELLGREVHAENEGAPACGHRRDDAGSGGDVDDAGARGDLRRVQ